MAKTPPIKNLVNSLLRLFLPYTHPFYPFSLFVQNLCYYKIMAYVTVFSEVPKQIVAGESVSWKITLDKYPASESWVLTYTLVATDEQISIVAVADDDDHLVEIPLADTDDYSDGEYSYQAHVSNGSERYLVGTGIIEILPDYATKESGHDGRAWLDIVIEALEASIQGRASQTQVFQTVAGVQIQHMTLMEQIEALKEFKRMKAGKRMAKTFGKALKVRFQ